MAEIPLFFLFAYTTLMYVNRSTAVPTVLS